MYEGLKRRDGGGSQASYTRKQPPGAESYGNKVLSTV
jgi:hypothetical protein